MGTLRPSGASARERITSLAESLRIRLRDLPHLIGLAHDRGRTPAMFLPVEQVMAAELATVGVRGKDAALALAGHLHPRGRLGPARACRGSQRGGGERR